MTMASVSFSALSITFCAMCVVFGGDIITEMWCKNLLEYAISVCAQWLSQNTSKP